jgi:hypothetical protein
MSLGSRRARILGVSTAVAVTVTLVLTVWLPRSAARTADQGSSAAPRSARPSGTEAELEQLRGLLPDQAHVMRDIGFHVTSMWRAAEQKNWPLARFYYDLTLKHLGWAVRLRPVLKVSTGQDVSLANILDGLEADGGPFPMVKAELERKDLPKFQAAYRTMLEGCYACHKAAERGFLRPQIPAGRFDIINPDPAATWPL